jgi:hypothetical protein
MLPSNGIYRASVTVQSESSMTGNDLGSIERWHASLGSVINLMKT